MENGVTNQKFSLPLHLMLVIFSLLIFSNFSKANTYYVTANANGSGNGTANDPWTIFQAANNAQPGDEIILAIGDYDISQGIHFSTDGTANNPIVWIGTISGNDYSVDETTSDGTLSTVLRNVTGSSNGVIAMNGDYNEFHNMVFEQDYDQKNLINIQENMLHLIVLHLNILQTAAVLLTIQ